MKKQFMFTRDSSFTHVKDKMHMEVTEHIIKDDQTGKLYHHVVSYGSWFRISSGSIFMSHLLKKIGITGFSVSYSADDCEIVLPWYPYHMPKTKSVVELPEFVELEDVQFGSSTREKSEEFKQTFVGKTFKLKYEGGYSCEMKGEELLARMLGCSVFYFGKATIEDKDYPLCCLLYKSDWLTGIERLIEILIDTDIGKQPEIRQLLEKFAGIDIEKAIRSFEQEMQDEFTELKKDLIERQEIIKDYLTKYKIQVKEEGV